MSGILRVYVAWKTLWEADIQPQPWNVYYSLCKSPLLRACTARQDQSRDRLTLAHFGRCARSCATAAGLHWTWAVLSSHEWMKYRNANAILPLKCKQCCLVVTNEKQILSAKRECGTYLWQIHRKSKFPVLQLKWNCKAQDSCEVSSVHIKLTIFCTTWKIIWW